MITVATNEAKTHLSALLQQVKKGESVIIAHGKKPVAKLVPLDPVDSERPKVGDTLDKPMHIPEEAFAPLSPDELRTWGLR
ncbi:MAG TPA: type II toxin-antitoxin system prevent-host-death family antitoxin [Kiritimatiellia bacterium]|nr:type II toxin-antitoxin system prevent-host-death family antitoxin [Kiritimatiellia bacterium]HMO99727.1 type II toxin-antitoxin system prevent-host-death family antitoxin [Kiritimatiellia bacterium]HMP97426.1 type II toxin-antitoxin system prevent-host-death family antitoxin [Kiritimatiellia bacterium]